MQTRSVDILRELEMASRSHMSETATKNSGLWIEHVLPQTWTDAWPFPDGHTHEVYSDELDALARCTLIHPQRNLTLLIGDLTSPLEALDLR